MMLGIDPKVDFVFKRLFGVPQNDESLIDVINAVLKPRPGHGVVGVTLRNPYNEKEFEEDKLSIVDIKAEDQSGRQFNIEMEMAPDRYFTKRVLYYWAKRYADQLHEGQPYEELKKTIVIAFVNAAVFRQSPGYHHAFTIRDASNTLSFTDDFEGHILEIGKFDKQTGELADPLDAWLFFLKNAERLDPASLPSPLGRPGIQRAVKELTMLTKEERERYEARLRAVRDERSRLLSARLDGIEEGEAKGRSEGRSEGQAQNLCEVISSLAKALGRMIDNEDLAKRSVAELKTIQDGLLAEVISRGHANGKS